MIDYVWKFRFRREIKFIYFCVIFLFADDQVAHQLLSMMLDPNPELRLEANAILKHPFFWSHERQLAFFQVKSHTAIFSSP